MSFCRCLVNLSCLVPFVLNRETKGLVLDRKHCRSGAHLGYLPRHLGPEGEYYLQSLQNCSENVEQVTPYLHT